MVTPTHDISVIQDNRECIQILQLNSLMKMVSSLAESAQNKDCLKFFTSKRIKQRCEVC
jgi:hypothetical protein